MFNRLHGSAASVAASEAKERAETRDVEESNRLLVEACQRVLADLSRKPTTG
jgi:hypothetical protein